MAKNSFGQKLKEIRKARNLTQAQLAELAGANEKHISKIETGVYFPTYNTLIKILSALDLTFEDIGLDAISSSHHSSNNPFYIKSIQILQNANNEEEIEFYYGMLKQAQKGISLIKNN